MKVMFFFGVCVIQFVFKALHALEAKKPRVRYYVTFPTYLFATLRRLLSHRGLDWVLRRVSRGENQ